ncbi:MAG: hypothetical protein AB4050_07800 [Synechococcus sp.]
MVGLIWWALLLMEQASQRQEFSRMLAGMLVVAAAAGVLAVHFLIDDYVAFVLETQTIAQQAEYSGFIANSLLLQ